MKLFSVLLLLLTPLLALGQLGPKVPKGDHIPLEVKGAGVHKVQVDVVKVFKEDRTAVSSFPVYVHAPAGGGIYFWTYPQGVVAADRGDVLEITSAPKGEITVTVKALVIDWDKKKTHYDIATVTFIIGDVPPPVPPVPPPVPPPGPTVPAQLLADLKAALAKDGADKAADLWAALDLAASAAADESRTTTLGQVAAVYQAHGQAKVGTALPATRQVMSSYIASRLGKDMTEPLGGSGAQLRMEAISTFQTAAAALHQALK